MSAEEATVNPDGSTTFESTGDAGAGAEYDPTDTDGGDETFEDAGEAFEEAEEIVKGTDPAIFLGLAFIACLILYFLTYRRNKRKQMERESFFNDMDGDKVRNA